MNPGPFPSGFQQQQQQPYFNFYPNGACNQQADYGFTQVNFNNCAPNQFSHQQYLGTKQFTGTNHWSATHPGAPYSVQQHQRMEQFTVQYTAGIQYSLHPATSRFPVQQRAGAQYYAPPGSQCSVQQYAATQNSAQQRPQMSQYQSLKSGFFQSSDEKHPGSSTQFQGTVTSQVARTAQCTGTASRSQHTGVLQHTEPASQKSKNMQFPGKTAWPAQQKQQTPPYTKTSISTMPQAAAGSDNETRPQRDSGTTRQTSGYEFATTFNSEEVFGSVKGSESINSNNRVYRFAEPSGSSNELWQNGVMKKQRRRTFFEKHSTQGKADNSRKITEETSTENEERRERQEKIAHLILLQHIRDSYIKVKTLVILCQDFKNPVFGDFPSNKGEKMLLSNIAHFLNHELKKVRFANSDEKEKFDTSSDPILKSSIPEMKDKIFQLRETMNELAKTRKKIEADRNTSAEMSRSEAEKAELRRREKEAQVLNSALGGHKAKVSALRERRETEKRNFSLQQSQLKEDINRINSVETRDVRNQIETLQQRIGEEVKFYCELRENVRKHKTRNDNLRRLVREAEAKKKDLRKNLEHIAFGNGKVVIGDEDNFFVAASHEVNSCNNAFPPETQGYFLT